MKKEKKRLQKKREKSFTLIEVIVGTAIFLIVFLGIFETIQAGFRIINHTKNRIIATEIANQQLEVMRNLPYNSIGTIGGYPQGTLNPITDVLRNNISYTVKTRVDFIADPADGIAFPQDQCPNDYKKVQVDVSWAGRFPGEISFSTDIAPENLAQECAIKGGVLSVLVFDAYGKMVPSSSIEVRDSANNNILKTATPIGGEYYFPLAAGIYKIVVSKEGYNTERTYGINEIASPEKPNPIIIEGKLTEISFSIDKTSTISVNTFSPWGQDNFSDSFLDNSKISGFSNTVIENGTVKLAEETKGQYYSSGNLISVQIDPKSLTQWGQFLFSDSEPTNTDLKYQFLYKSGDEWILIPDQDLVGNSIGFDSSPVDLSGLDITDYPALEIKGNFFTLSPETTPDISDWQVSWLTNTPALLTNTAFHVRGDKIIGTDANDEPVYKYSTFATTDNNGNIILDNLEWDFYTFSVGQGSGLDLTSIEPSPQPINLSPNTNLSANLYLEAENTLLATIKDVSTGQPIFSASVRVFNTSLGYDVTYYTNNKGQIYFLPLEKATYSLEIGAPGCSSASTNVAVSGHTTKIINLEQIE